MSFNVALGGVNAAQKDLDVTSNNISNVNTTGFKESRAEFADIYTNSIFSNAGTQAGGGVKTATVAQQFHQGSLKYTNNNLDMAIAGEGYFVTSENALQNGEVPEYTRAGAFKLNEDGYIVNSAGRFLQGYGVDEAGNANGVSIAGATSLKIDESGGDPKATTAVDISFNVDNRAAGRNLSAYDDAGTSPIDIKDPSSYDSSTAVTVYDALGNPVTADLYFVKDETPTTTTIDNGDGTTTDVTTTPENQWRSYVYINGEQVTFDDGLGAGGTTGYMPMQFDGATGHLTSPASMTTSPAVQLTEEAAAQAITFNFNDPTQFAQNFEVTSMEQDGAAVGRLSGIDINDEGLISTTFTNGRTTYMGKVALAKFTNSQGLEQTGDTAWRETTSSGPATAGEANNGTFGAINSSALEQSNVNLTEQLVNLISAQRNFQANSRAIEVDSAIQQNIIQVR